jgi:hypothetical protein
MVNKAIFAIVCLVAAAFAAPKADAYEEYVTETGKPCSYCHVNPAGGGTRTAAGNYYRTNGVLPPPPSVTSITAASGPNTGSISISNLAGTTFLAGATVKLKRAEQPDITASSVTLVNASKITCVFNLTGKKTGLWDIFVANTDGLSGTLAAGFGIDIASGAPVAGGSINRMKDPVMAVLSAGRRMRVWGAVQVINPSTFWLDDGSASKIKVFAPGYSGLVNGSFVSATGGLDASSTPVTLVSSPAQIVKCR